jgi:hypothetical protein
MPQVKLYRPPPNPAKTTDSRFHGYQKLHGVKSWELDALSPEVLSKLIADEFDTVRDELQWDRDLRAQEAERQGLKSASSRWADVSKFLLKKPKKGKKKQ